MTRRVAVLLLVVLAACADDTPGPMRHATRSSSAPGAASTTVAPTSAPAGDTPAVGAAPSTTTPRPAATSHPVASSTTFGTPMEIRYRVERRTSDTATAGFEHVVRDTLADRRGWERAGFEFVEDASARYLVVLAEGDEVDRLCEPYDTYGRYSCQNGPVVALNADRWRSATPKWTGDLATYRQMLVNHEVGHLLGQKHPEPQCPRRGDAAPVMSQQSTELDGCLPNPWPLQWEVDLAARHDRPLAPGPDESRR